MRLFLICLLVFSSFLRAQGDGDLQSGDLVPSLGVNIYKDVSFSSDEFGDHSVTIYFASAKGDQEKLYYIKPFLNVDRVQFEKNIVSACDGKKDSDKARVNIPFQVASEKFIKLVIAEANKGIADVAKKIESIQPLTYHDLKLKNTHFSPKDGIWVSVVVANLDEYAAQNDKLPENGFDNHAFSFGSNSYAYDKCDNLKLYNTGDYKLEVTAGVRKVQQNFFNLSSSSFTQSEAFLDLEREASQSGGIEYSATNEYSDKGINVLFSSFKGGANKRKVKQNINLNDTRRRLVNLNLIKEAFHQHSELVQVRFESNFVSVNEEQFSKVMELMTKTFFENLEPVRVTVDLEKSLLVDGNMKYDLNPNEKTSLQTTGHLQFTDEGTATEAVEAAVDGVPIKANRSGQLNQTIKDERGVTYTSDGENWIPTSIDLYAVDTVKESLQRNFNVSDVRTVGDNFYSVFPVLETNNSAFKSLADSRLHDFKKELVDRLLENDNQWNKRFETLLLDLNNTDVYRLKMSDQAIRQSNRFGANQWTQYGKAVCQGANKSYGSMTWEESSKTFIVNCVSVR